MCPPTVAAQSKLYEESDLLIINLVKSSRYFLKATQK